MFTDDVGVSVLQNQEPEFGQEIPAEFLEGEGNALEENSAGDSAAVLAVPDAETDGSLETSQEVIPIISVEDYGFLMVRSIPIGILTGAMFMIVGLAVLGIVKIFKKV